MRRSARAVLVACVALLWVGSAVQLSAVGTATVTVRRATDVYRYTVAWTSTAGGAVSANPFTVVPGRLLSIRFSPNTGATQPSDLYDVTLAETGGVADLAAGQGANLTNAADVVIQWDPPLYQDGSRTVDVVVSNAGSAKTGTVVILVQVN